MKELVLISSLVGLLYSPIVLGAGISFRVLSFPDLTLEGGVLVSGAVCWRILVWTDSPVLALTCGIVSGGCAGLLTACIRHFTRLGPLLSSLVSASLLYSLFFRLTGGVANVDFEAPTVFRPFGINDVSVALAVAALLSLAVLAALKIVFSLRIGHLVRAYGEKQRFVIELAASTFAIEAAGLALANGTIGLGAAMAVQYSRVVDASATGGVLLGSLGALIFGETLVRPKSLGGFLGAALVGAVSYHLVVGASLYDWSPTWSRLVHSTDTRAVSAAFLGLAALFRRRQARVRLFSTEW